MQSKLGYLISGRVTSTANTINSNHPTNMLNVLLSHVGEDDQIERFWNLESLGITNKDSPVDETRSFANINTQPFPRNKTEVTQQNSLGRKITLRFLRTTLSARNVLELQSRELIKHRIYGANMVLSLRIKKIGASSRKYPV